MDEQEQLELINMELHEEFYLSAKGINILRVIGGWVYTSNTGSSTFVPLPKEHS